MALLKQGILGPFTGHCGPIIGYIRNGQFCVRSMPTHYHDRRSERQLQNRTRFTLVMKMMSLLRPVITLTFKHLATDMTEMNLATRANYYTLVKGQPQHLHYDLSGLILSQGNVEPLTDLILSHQGNTLTLHWNSQTVPGGSHDQVSILLLNPKKMQMRFHRNIALRQQGTATLTIPTTWHNEETYLYTMVQRADQWSNSALAGTLPSTQKIAQTTPSPTPLTSQLSTLTSNLSTLSSNLSTLSSKSNPSHQTPIKLLFLSPPTEDKTTPQSHPLPPKSTPT